MSINLLAGDCRDILPTLAADSVQCVVTSPPYYGLRDYGTALWDGGDAACDHAAEKRGGRFATPVSSKQASNTGSGTISQRDCPCGATRVDRQIGLEATPDEYLATMVSVFREIRRVLRPDGTVWCNMGDSYNTYPGNRGASKSLSANTNDAIPSLPSGHGLTAPGLAAKQLLMMPARLALALQADGWWLRSDIIWHKPNPMPESVTDRCVSAHEHVFMLTKRSRYFYDAAAIAEPANWPEGSWSKSTKTYYDETNAGSMRNGGRWEGGATRNCRNVWTIATAPYSGAHFATFPSALAERCIRAGTSERGACSQCGAPWERVTEREGGTYQDRKARGVGGPYNGKPEEYPQTYGIHVATTTGWAPGCKCSADVVPCRVLDPFAGAGTTLLVADRLQRDAVGIELSPDYTRMAMKRCQDDAPLFTSFPPAKIDPQDERMRDLFREAAD